LIVSSCGLPPKRAVDRKSYFDGTHRVRSPEETLAWIKPVASAVGITRVADLTFLDEIGIPVYQAIRPNALLASVSQGKGATRAAAKISAIMESIETWHAETLPPSELVATVSDVEKDLGYELHRFGLTPRHHLNPGTRLEWVAAKHLHDDKPTLVPAAFVRTDGRVEPRWKPPLFHVSTNGLASGNVASEAVAHGLYEIIERDAHMRSLSPETPPQRVSLETVSGASAELLDKFKRSGTQVEVYRWRHPTMIPVFDAKIWSSFFGSKFSGHGAHLDADVALTRALTEAAQSRATAIVGTRDDIGSSVYRRAASFWLSHAGQEPSESSDSSEAEIPFDAIPSEATQDLQDDVRLLVSRLVDRCGSAPLVVDLTRQELGVPVVRVIGPGLLCPTAH
jgi:ribosomal protein S12 methylthiotransferase accessory factor